jgi:hypothetical protein
MSSASRSEIIGVESIISETTLPLVIVAVWVGLFYSCYYVSSITPFSAGNLNSIVYRLICTMSTFGVLSFFVSKKMKRWTAGIILIFCVGADIGLNILLQNRQITSTNILLHYYAGINLTLLGIALCGGILLSETIKKPSYLIPLVVAAGLADIWSVSFGVTNEIIQSRTAMNYLLFSFPVSRKDILPVIGVTDFIFAAMFLSLSFRFGMPVSRTRILVAASFFISITVAVFCGFGMPVLPVMGLFFVIGQYEYVKIVDPKEKRDAVYGILIIAAALAAITFIKYRF